MVFEYFFSHSLIKEKSFGRRIMIWYWYQSISLLLSQNSLSVSFFHFYIDWGSNSWWRFKYYISFWNFHFTFLIDFIILLKESISFTDWAFSWAVSRFQQWQGFFLSYEKQFQNMNFEDLFHHSYIQLQENLFLKILQIQYFLQ